MIVHRFRKALMQDQTAFLRKFFLGFPIVYLLLISFEILFLQKSLMPSVAYLQILEDIVLLDGLHVVFSFFFLNNLKGSQNYLTQMSNHGIHLIRRGAFIFILLYILFYIMDPTQPWIIYLYIPIIFIIPFHHGFQQSKGLLLVLMKNRFPGMKLLMESYFWLLVIRNTLLFIDPKVIPFFKFIQAPFIWSLLNWTSIILPCLMLLAFYIFIWRNESRDVQIFSLRFLVQLMQPFSLLALYSAGVIHGSEYMYVASKTLSEENKNSGSLKTFFFIAQVTSLAALAICLWPHYFIPALNLAPGFFPALRGFGFAVVYTHYVLDHYLYSARYLPSKAYFLKILKSA